VPDDVAGLDDVLPFAAEHGRKIVEIVRQLVPVTPKAFNLSSNCIAVVLQIWQSVWPMMAISLPPLTAHASASDAWCWRAVR